MKQVGNKEVCFQSQKPVFFFSFSNISFIFPQRGWWEIPQHCARWRSALMVETIQEKLIIKKLVALPLLRQCLSFAETVLQPAPDVNAKSWLCLLLTLLWLSCCPELHAGSCRLFIGRLSFYRPSPAYAFLFCHRLQEQALGYLGLSTSKYQVGLYHA